MVFNKSNDFSFLLGGGDMGAEIRLKDWSLTPLGLPQTWPISLRTIVTILLNSQFPMFVWWGKEHTTIYNDAYRIILGDKHPAALGEAGPKVWSEIWDVVGPLAQRVFEKGISNWAEDQLLYINRHGYTEESYFTFSYSPIIEENGKVGGVFCVCTETTEKVLANRKLAESEQALRNMILQAPAAMCILKGEAFIIEVANEKMFEVWGIPAEGVIGMPLFDAVPEAKNEGYEELMNGVLKTGESYIGKEQPVSLPRNGKVETVYIDFNYKAVREANGNITGVMVMVTDVTQQVLSRMKIEEVVALRTNELAKTNEALINSNLELSRSNANLEEFAHAASHDMKEPIRKVLTFSDRLKSSLEMRMTDTEKHLFHRMENATQRMRLLVDDLLNFSHVSERPIEKEDVDLNEKIKHVLVDMELLIEQKQAQINMDRLPTVKGYKRQLQQLFQNLIANALKYSKKDVRPEISISSQVVTGQEVQGHIITEQQDRSFYLIEVADNGIGFEQEYAERIFGMFQRLHGKAEYEGTGLGLSITRKVVENHNGYIWAESQPGCGALFKVLLPV